MMSHVLQVKHFGVQMKMLLAVRAAGSAADATSSSAEDSQLKSCVTGACLSRFSLFITMRICNVCCRVSLSCSFFFCLMRAWGSAFVRDVLCVHRLPLLLTLLTTSSQALSTRSSTFSTSTYSSRLPLRARTATTTSPIRSPLATSSGARAAPSSAEKPAAAVPPVYRITVIMRTIQPLVPPFLGTRAPSRDFAYDRG